MLPIWTRVNLGAMAMKGYSAFQKLKHYWKLTIKLLSAHIIVVTLLFLIEERVLMSEDYEHGPTV